MQTIAALDAVKAAGLDAASEHFLGITEPAKPGKRNGLRDLLRRARRPRCWITIPASAAASRC